MPDFTPRARRYLQIAAALMGAALLSYLILRAGTDKLLENVKQMGWGILLVLGLAGISHLVKTWAWRLTLPGQFKKVSFSRTLGLRLVSEAMGQLGFVGQMVGDATRGSLLTSDLPASGIISSVTLDRGLFMGTGLIVTIAGFAALLFMPAIPGGLRLYASLFAVVLVALLALSVWAIQNGWPVLSRSARLAGRIPWFKTWLHSKEAVILSAEQQLLTFHRQAPRAFWASTLLNFVAHGLAIAEVYLILLLVGSKVTLTGALMLEALTKLINAVGTINPGNVGTYEGGNMAIVKLLGLAPAEGLTLGLCRRFRSIVWAIIGGICLLYFSRLKKTSQPNQSMGKKTESNMLEQETGQNDESTALSLKVAVVLANQPASSLDLSHSALAQVGALPLVLRAIMSARSAGADRVLVVVDPVNGARIRQSLARTGRLPSSVEWVEVSSHIAAVSAVLGSVVRDASRVILVRGDCSYQPSLYRTASEWDGDGALELVSGGALVGLTALSRDLALDLVRDSNSKIGSIEELHEWIRTRHVGKFGPTVVYCETAPQDSWQKVANEQDRLVAEKKLESWLVKPTDGIFARMNRKVSIPISRQLIKFPITPNMVSLFTLGVSFASGLYFGLGGYWHALIGAVLSVWASILDGCDGEVARLKLQVSDFGCWLDTICDYLYYIFIFVGMTVGLVRSTGKTSYLTWGGMLLLGAIAMFVLASIGRKRLSGQRPEQYLAVWQKKAESQMSNPLAYIGRHLEFIIRRCFLPYALLAFALLNLTWIPICVGAVGATLAWIICAYSLIAFSPKEPTLSASSAAAARL
ncbi:MAG: lysylphosphatidylglycerol synthase domain-containing protein [Candidatus Korobacteraceae bacterium]